MVCVKLPDEVQTRLKLGLFLFTQDTESESALRQERRMIEFLQDVIRVAEARHFQDLLRKGLKPAEIVSGYALAQKKVHSESSSRGLSIFPLPCRFTFI